MKKSFSNWFDQKKLEEGFFDAFKQKPAPPKPVQNHLAYNENDPQQKQYFDNLVNALGLQQANIDNDPHLKDSLWHVSTILNRGGILQHSPVNYIVSKLQGTPLANQIKDERQFINFYSRKFKMNPRATVEKGFYQNTDAAKNTAVDFVLSKLGKVNLNPVQAAEIAQGISTQFNIPLGDLQGFQSLVNAGPVDRSVNYPKPAPKRTGRPRSSP